MLRSFYELAELCGLLGYSSFVSASLHVQLSNLNFLVDDFIVAEFIIIDQIDLRALVYILSFKLVPILLSTLYKVLVISILTLRFLTKFPPKAINKAQNSQNNNNYEGQSHYFNYFDIFVIVRWLQIKVDTSVVSAFYSHILTFEYCSF
jgi:hypothetical protein